MAASLQIFLKGRLAVRLREIFTAFLESKIEQSAAEHLAGGFQPSIEVYRGNHSFKCVGQERGLFAAGGLFFATAQAQVFTETQAPRGHLQGAGIHNARTAFGQLPFAPLGKFLEQTLAGQHVQDGVAEEFELFVVLRQVLRG